MKKALLLLLIIFITGEVIGRDERIDSLTQVLKTVNEDTSRVNTLVSLSKELMEVGNLNEAMAHANEALLLAKKVDFKKGIASANSVIGLIYIKIGNIFYLQDNYPEALKNYLITLKLGEQINDKQLIAYGYNNMGNIYKQQGNYPEALKNYYATLRLYEEIGNKPSIAFSYNNIGNIYLAQNNYTEALKNYTASLKIQEAIANKQGIAFGYINLGELYIKLQNFKDATEYLNKGLLLSQEIGDTQSVAVTYNNLGLLYIKLNKLQAAEEYLNNGLRVSKELGSKDLIKDCYQTLSELDSMKGNITGAFEYYKLYSQLKDSILNEQTNKQVSQLKIQYESDKKDHQIKTQSLQNTILQNRIYYSIAFSLVIIGIVIMWFYLRNRRKKAAYEHTLVSLELTALKSQLNPHFISNSLSAIKSFIDKQPERASQFLSKFSKLMRRVLEQSELQSVSLQQELETAELYMQIESLRLKYGFDYTIDCDPDIDQEMIIVPPLILQPAIENAIRHGLAPMEERGMITISVRLENDLLKLTIEDNGVGKEFMGENKDERPAGEKSFGLSITRKRIDILSKELRKQGYLELKFLPGRTITEVAFPVN